MDEIIDRNIDNNEVIIRFIFKGDIKESKRNKPFVKESIIEKDVFIDTRPNIDVSLLRIRYNKKCECIRRGYEVKSDFIGFLVFRKNHFDNSVSQHKILEAYDFEAQIVSSPLDENHKIIPLEKEVRIDTPINPGHSDLIYINPGLTVDDENPNIAIRRFSRRFFKNCKVFFENNNDYERVMLDL